MLSGLETVGTNAERDIYTESVEIEEIVDDIQKRRKNEDTKFFWKSVIFEF